MGHNDRSRSGGFLPLVTHFRALATEHLGTAPD